MGIEIDRLIASGDLVPAIREADRLARDAVRERKLGQAAWAARKEAQCRFMQNDLATAIDAAKRSLGYAREAGDLLEEAEAENVLGVLWSESGELAKAVQHLERSFRLHREAGSDRVATVLNNIGNTCLIMDDAERALGYFRKALVASRETDPAGELPGTALANVGRALTALGRPDEAVAVLRESVEHFASAGMSTLHIHGLAKLAAACSAMRNYDEAENLYRDALASASARGDAAWIHELHGSLGTLLFDLGRYEEAEEHVAQAIEAVCDAQGSRDLPYWRKRYSRIREHRGDLHGALAHMRKAFDDLERSMEERTQRRLFRAMGRVEIERIEHEKELYRVRNEELSSALRQVEALRVELEARNGELSELAIRDSLTSAFNRRWFDERLTAEIERARRYLTPLSVAILDLDSFKAINDTFGHHTGDEVLVEFARFLADGTRASDAVARYGGEEFAVAMPETAIDEARRACEKLRSALASYDWGRAGVARRITFSAGVALLEDDDSLASLISRADRRLYEAKRRGRNLVVSHG